MKPVLVTTENRGVFFGYLSEKQSVESKIITLSKCRNCLYWSSSIKGFLGLSTSGPDKSCRVGPAAEELTLQNVTSVCKVSEQAVKAWESEPWN